MTVTSAFRRHRRRAIRPRCSPHASWRFGPRCRLTGCSTRRRRRYCCGWKNCSGRCDCRRGHSRRHFPRDWNPRCWCQVTSD